MSIGRITAALTDNTEFQPKKLLLSALSSATWVNNLNADTRHCCAGSHNLCPMLIVCNMNQLVLSMSWVKHVNHHFKPWIYFCIQRYLVQSESVGTCQPWEENKHSISTLRFTNEQSLDTFVCCHKVGYRAMWTQIKKKQKTIASVSINW